MQRRSRTSWSIGFLVLLVFHVSAEAADHRVAIRPGPGATRQVGEVSFAWLGVTHWLMETPVGSALLDAYLSRPPFPEIGTTEHGLAQLHGLLAAARPGPVRWIFVGHSHFDHAVDAGVFAAETGALVIGSASTCFVARAGGLPARRCRVVEDGDRLRFGRLEVDVLRTPHTAPTAPGLGLFEELSAPPPSAAAGPNGGNLSFLFRLRAPRGAAELSWLYSNSISAIDSDDGSGLDYRASFEALFSPRTRRAGPDLWLVPPFLTPAELADYLDIVQPRAVLPHHFDGIAPILQDGLAARFAPTPEVSEELAARGIAFASQEQYADRFVLDRFGVERRENEAVKRALDIPLEPAE